MRELVRAVIFGLGVCAYCGPSAWAGVAAGFYRVGDLPGGNVASYGYGVSADGTVVTGFSVSATGNEAFRWTLGSGIQGLGDFPGGNLASYGYGVSGDGATIVGIGGGANYDEGFRYTVAGGLQHLSSPPVATEAAAVSYDGSVIVGDAAYGTVYRAARWVNGVFQFIGPVPAGNYSGSSAASVSGDGSVAAGTVAVNGTALAMRWTEQTGVQTLGVVAGDYRSAAYGISRDGRVIVGDSLPFGGGEVHAFRWTASGGVQALGDLPGGTVSSIAWATNPDGSIVVGQSQGANLENAFIWTESTGMITLRSYLQANGVIVPDTMRLSACHAISDDGLTFVGFGVNADTDTVEGFVAVIPSPGGVIVMGLAGMVAGLRRSR